MRRAFGLGEECIRNPFTCAFDEPLHLHDSVLDWLRAGRHGVYVLPWRWGMAFDVLRDVQKIDYPKSLHASAKAFILKPPRVPELFVRCDTGRAAA